jgi:hypothetical protein
MRVVVALAIVLALVFAAYLGWGLLHPDLELPVTGVKPLPSAPLTVEELRAVTWDQLVPYLKRLITVRPDPDSKIGLTAWVCHDVRDLDGLYLLGYRVLIPSGDQEKRKPLSEYMEEGDTGFDGVFEKEALKQDLLPYFEAERQAMIAEREE